MKRYFTVAISFTFSVVFSEKKLQIDASVFIFAPKFLTFFELTSEVKSSYSPPSSPPPPPPCKTEARESRKWLIHYQIFLFHACSAHLWFESCLVVLCIRRPYLDKSSALPRAQSLKTTWFHATLDNKHYKITDLSQWLIDNSKEIEIFTFIS